MTHRCHVPTDSIVSAGKGGVGLVARINIYASDDDLIPVFDSIDAAIELTYARFGQWPTKRIEAFHCGRDIPGLGREASDSSVRSAAYIVTRRDLPLAVREIEPVTGGFQYVLDQLTNDDTIVVTPGGRWSADVVLSGSIVTASNTSSANGLMNIFRRRVIKHFNRVKAFWVGPKAGAVLDAGGRLTAATQMPREYDLIRE